MPTSRAFGQVLEILVDSHERYGWRFSAQQATTRRQALTAGDYAVERDGGWSGAGRTRHRRQDPGMGGRQRPGDRAEGRIPRDLAAAFDAAHPTR